MAAASSGDEVLDNEDYYSLLNVRREVRLGRRKLVRFSWPLSGRAVFEGWDWAQRSGRGGRKGHGGVSLSRV